MIKLVAIDIDETLLNSRKELTPKTRETLKRTIAQGVKVVLCSGRPYLGVKPYVDALGLAGSEQFAVTYNGAIVRNLQGQAVVKQVLTYADLLFLQKFAQKAQIPLHFEQDEQNITLAGEVNQFMRAEEKLLHVPFKQVEPNEVAPDAEFAKAMFSGTQATIDHFLSAYSAELSQRYSVSSSFTGTAHFAEINALKASKGTAIRGLAQLLALNPDECLVIGDGLNDLSMFTTPGFVKVAMGNAITQLQKLADFVTKTNDEDGVAWAVEKYILAK